MLIYVNRMLNKNTKVITDKHFWMASKQKTEGVKDIIVVIFKMNL